MGVDRLQRGAGRDVVTGDKRQATGAGNRCALPRAASEYPRRQPGPFTGHGVRVNSVDVVAAVQHGQDVTDLFGEIR